FHRRVYVLFSGLLEDADQLAGIGGIAVFERFPGRGLYPLAVNEVLEHPRLACAEARGSGQGIGCHKVSLLDCYECPNLLMLQRAGSSGRAGTGEPRAWALPGGRGGRRGMICFGFSFRRAVRVRLCSGIPLPSTSAGRSCSAGGPESP